MGQRAVRTVNGQRGENVTIILAISPQNGVEKYSFHVGGTTTVRFADFFRGLEEQIGWDVPCIFVMDNARCHRSVRTLSDAHVIRYLPPYSPFLTPVENAFSAWKSMVKNNISDPSTQRAFANPPDISQGARSWRQQFLMQHGEAALTIVTAEKCANWQRHCTSVFPRCLREEDILM